MVSSEKIATELSRAFLGFRLTRVVLAFRVLHGGQLPPWLGSAWRGMLGHGLKSAVCTTGLDDCRPCPLIDDCPYPVLFEARVPLNAPMLGSNTKAPGPYTLLASPGGRVASDDELTLRLTLFGEHGRDAALLARVFALGADSGLGERRLGLTLQRLAEVDLDGGERELGLAQLHQAPPSLAPLAALPPCPPSLAIHLLTPLRLRVRNRYVGPDCLCFGDFLSHLLRRCSLLLQFYQQTPVELPFRELVDLAHKLQFSHTELRWEDMARHSSRQERVVPMGGLVGTMYLEDERLQALWPLLWLGQWTQLGKGVSMGLGEYRLEAA